MGSLKRRVPALAAAGNDKPGAARAYQRHKPGQGLLYRVLAEHLRSCLSEQRAISGGWMEMPQAVNIGSRRELFWDDYLIDTARTTAGLKLHTLQPKEVAINHDEPWEGDGCDFHCIVAADGLYRMYYLGWETMDPDVTRHIPRPIVVCYAESTDGFHWTKPNLGLVDYKGGTKNNICDVEPMIIFKSPNFRPLPIIGSSKPLIFFPCTKPVLGSVRSTREIKCLRPISSASLSITRTSFPCA